MPLFETRQNALRYVRSATIGFFLFVLVSIFPLRSFQVAGQSMAPRLVDGEKILVQELLLPGSAIARGDILVFRHPHYRYRYVVKRVIGLPGETVEMRGGLLFIDGERLREWYLPSSSLDRFTMAPRRLGPTDLFVLGDHRNDSEDSRSWGPLRRELVVGRAMVSYWPPSAASYLR